MSVVSCVSFASVHTYSSRSNHTSLRYAYESPIYLCDIIVKYVKSSENYSEATLRSPYNPMLDHKEIHVVCWIWNSIGSVTGFLYIFYISYIKHVSVIVTNLYYLRNNFSLPVNYR